MARSKMTDSEKEARRAVREYLAALEATKPKRGRKRTPDSIDKQLAALEESVASASPLKKLELAQERLDLTAERERLLDAVDPAPLEAKFVEHAQEYGAQKGITWAAWREVGVAADVLKAAGITRSS